MNRVAVLIPALDEEEALPRVLAALPGGLAEVVVVDNGSRDRTAQVARKAGATVIHEPRRGYGSACLAGLAHLERQEAPPLVVVFLDADQGRPESLERLTAPILAGGADMVLGVRGGERGAVPFHARWGNTLVLGLARLLHGMHSRDLPPFRAVSLAALRRLEMDDPDWGWTLQMQIRAAHRGLRVQEVVLPHQPRRAGRSKISGTLGGSVRAGWTMLRTVAGEWWIAARLSAAGGSSPGEGTPGDPLPRDPLPRDHLPRDGGAG